MATKTIVNPQAIGGGIYFDFTGMGEGVFEHEEKFRHGIPYLFETYADVIKAIPTRNFPKNLPILIYFPGVGMVTFQNFIKIPDEEYGYLIDIIIDRFTPDFAKSIVMQVSFSYNPTTGEYGYQEYNYDVMTYIFPYQVYEG